MAKLTGQIHGLRPFAGIGPTFRLTQNLASASPYGFTAAGGLDIPVRRIRVIPQVRFTHWGADKSLDIGPVQNQVGFLAGFAF